MAAIARNLIVLGLLAAAVIGFRSYMARRAEWQAAETKAEASRASAAQRSESKAVFGEFSEGSFGGLALEPATPLPPLVTEAPNPLQLDAAAPTTGGFGANQSAAPFQERQNMASGLPPASALLSSTPLPVSAGLPQPGETFVDPELASIPVPSSFEDTQPGPAAELLYQGTALLEQGKADEATKLFYQALKAEPSNARAYAALGQCYLSVNQLPKAIANLDMAIRLNPKGTASYVHRGTANIKLRYIDRAIDDFSAALKLDSHNIAALTWRSIAYINSGHPREARKDCTAVLEIHSGVLDAYVVRCLANLQLGDPRAAKADYHAGVEHGLQGEMVATMEGWFKAFGQQLGDPPQR